MPIERVVTILTPLFGALSAWLTGLIAANFPGLPAIPAGDVTALEIAGFTGAVGAAVHWLHGRQKFVQAEGDVGQFVDKVVASIKENQTAAPALSDIESIVKQHADEVVKTLGDAIHLPPSAEAVAQEMVNRLVNPSRQVVVHDAGPLETPAAPAAPTVTA